MKLLRRTKFDWTGLFLLTIFIFLQCDPNNPDSLFNSNYDPGTPPTLTDITPTDSAWAGEGILTITGEGFYPNDQREKNVVFFNSTLADVVASTQTSVSVKSPMVVDDSTQVRISRVDAEHYSNELRYKMKPSVQSFGSLESNEIAKSMAADANHNVYISAQPNKLKIFDKDGNKIKELETPTFLFAYSLAMGSDGLYGGLVIGGRRKEIVKIDTTDGSFTTFASIANNPGPFDFGPDGNIWVAAEDAIIRVKPDASSEIVEEFDIPLRGLRVFDNAVFVLGRNTDGSENKIWRCDIVNDTLDTPILSFDRDAHFDSTVTIHSLNFRDDGIMVIGTNGADPIYKLTPDANYEIFDTGDVIFPGLVQPRITNILWNNGPYFIAIQESPTRGTTQLFKIDAKGPGATYWGR